MAGGFKSALPLLGLSSEPKIVQGGFITPLPNWNAGGTAAAPTPTPDTSYKGGGRMLRKGKLPEWWEDWEEPQPKEDSPPTKEQLARLAAGLPLPAAEPKPERKRADVVPIRPKPPIQRTASVTVGLRLKVQGRVVPQEVLDLRKKVKVLSALILHMRRNRK